MAEVLSQNEIDALLTAISSGDVKSDDPVRDEQAKKKLKIYDFKRPDKFSKEQLRTIGRIHETFARLCNTFLSTQLRSMVNIDVVSTDQITYEEFVRSIANPTVMVVFSAGTLEGNAILEINLGIVFTILDRLFGGMGKSLEKLRVLSEIEESVIRRIILRILDYLKEAWLQVIELNPKLELIESNPQFTQVVPPGEMVLLVTLELKIGDTEGIMNLCIPYLVLEPIVGKLTTQSWFSPIRKEISSENLISIETKLKRAMVPISIEVGKSNIRLSELLSVRPGDVIPLDKKKDELMDMKVGDTVKFKCKPGQAGNKFAVVIDHIIKDEEEALLC